MSDAAYKNRKVSREGIVLIKSFEGFRPRAIQRTQGGWIIGYGHTLSAREGATVSEADAELLLRYDLLPVEASVNTAIPGDLNQHQFDALVSFAFSVGLDRFAGSDVLQRFNAGAAGEAADAIMGWPEPALPETALRRRAAERALFVANPAAPVALADLLSAPLPPPAVPTPVTLAEAGPAAPEDAPVEVEDTIADTSTYESVAEDETPDEHPTAETTADGVEVTADESAAIEPVIEEAAVEETATEEAAADDSADQPATIDSRGAAVAALLGERAERIVHPDTVIPIFGQPARNDAAGEAFAGNDQIAAEAEVTELDAAEAETVDPVPAEPVIPETESVSPLTVDTDAPAFDSELQTEATTPSDVTPDDHTSPVETAVETTDDVAAPVDVQPSAASEGLNTARYLPYSAAMIGPLPGLPANPRANVAEPVAEPVISAAVELEGVATTPSIPAVADAEIEPLIYRPSTALPPAEAFAATTADALVLTPFENSPEPALSRPAWSPEDRDDAESSENTLFGEDLTLTRGGSIIRSDIDAEAPTRFDWKETGPFIFMGGVGLVSFGASMAAFRRAAEHSGSSDLTIIGWVLALIGLGCVGVSSVNLYRRFGLPGAD